MNDDVFETDISKWIAQVTAHDELAAQQLVDRYYLRLVGLARQKLRVMPSPLADDEGAVVSALRSFFSGIEGGQFHEFKDEDDLWRLLATITARKCVAQLRRHWRQKGEAGRVDRQQEIVEVIDESPSPQQVAELIDDCERKVAALEDETLRRVAILRLEGHDTRQIASEMGVHTRTIQRKLLQIQTLWLEAEDTSGTAH